MNLFFSEVFFLDPSPFSNLAWDRLWRAYIFKENERKISSFVDFSNFLSDEI